MTPLLHGSAATSQNLEHSLLFSLLSNLVSSSPLTTDKKKLHMSSLFGQLYSKTRFRAIITVFNHYLLATALSW